MKSQFDRPGILFSLYFSLCLGGAAAAEPHKERLDNADGSELAACGDGIQSFNVSHRLLGDIGKMRLSVQRNGSNLLISRKADIRASARILGYSSSHVSHGTEVWADDGIVTFRYVSTDESSNWDGKIHAVVSGKRSGGSLSVKVSFSGAVQEDYSYEYQFPSGDALSLWTETPWCGAIMNAKSIVDVVEGRIYEYGANTSKLTKSDGNGELIVTVTGVRDIFFNGFREPEARRTQSILRVGVDGRVQRADIVKFGQRLRIVRE